jgi:hypothetical protein
MLIAVWMSVALLHPCQSSVKPPGSAVFRVACLPRKGARLTANCDHSRPASILVKIPL